MIAFDIRVSTRRNSALFFTCVEVRSLQRVFFKIHLAGMLLLCRRLHILLNTIPKFDELSQKCDCFHFYHT
jgi:hypothetical protein